MLLLYGCWRRPCSKGDSYDNALAETINGLYKAELVHRRPPWKTREAVKLPTLEWVSWFNWVFRPIVTSDSGLS